VSSERTPQFTGRYAREKGEESDATEDASNLDGGGMSDVRTPGSVRTGEMTRDSKRPKDDQELEPLSYRALILAVVVIVVGVVLFSTIVARVQSPWITPDHFAP
jgi:hypothetical protein